MKSTMLDETFENENGAIIDSTERYRYSLWRNWDITLPRVTFIMLNPSTADSSVNDPTINRCIAYAKNWGYGSLEVVNLFAYRATKPIKLRGALDPIGEENNQHILNALTRSEKVIPAWGINGTLLNRDKDVIELLRQNDAPVFALQLTKDGHPRHPLFVKANRIPELYM